MQRRFWKVLVGGGLALAVLVPVGAASAATTGDFAGLWTSTDAVDGSQQVMLVTAGRRILLVDTSATACDGAPAIATGRGTVVGDDLTATLRLSCLGGGGLTGVPATFTYDAGTGTLTDDLGGTVWSSARG